MGNFVEREALNRNRMKTEKYINKKNIRGAFALALILCLCAGCSSSNSPKATETEQDAFMANASENQGTATQIQDELQWSENFSWSYCPEEYEEDGNKEKAIGYFTQNADSENITMHSGRNDAGVLVFRQEFKEAGLYEQIKEEENQFEGCLIGIIGGTELTLAVRVEADAKFQEKPYGNCYELHLQQDEVGYTFRAMNLSKGEWYDFLEELLLTADLHWGEQDAYVDTVFPELTNARKRLTQDCWWLQFDGVLLPMEWERLISCNLCEDGLHICYIQYSWQEEESDAAECLLHHVEPFPAFETESELYDWLKEKIPSIQDYAAYLEDEVFEGARFEHEDAAARVLEKTLYREILTKDGQGLLYLTYENQYYEFCYDTAWGDIWRCPFDQYAMRSILGVSLGFEVTVSENGLKNRYDNLREKYYLQQEIGEDIFSFAVEYVYQPGDDEREFEDIGYLWKISVYRNEESEPFQEIETESSAFYECPLSFYDFNADGYEDLIVYYYYGANGGSESRYLWSPSRESFVYFPDLEYYGSYYVDPETRRLYIHYHGSAVSGSDEVYQWKNEMDCELLRSVSYYPSADDGMTMKISGYDGDREKILSDYTYNWEEFDAREDDIWGIYYEDFVWEQELTVDGETYILRYAQRWYPEIGQDGEYSGRLYIHREDTYLIRVIWDSELISPWSHMEWSEEDGEKYLVIHHTDGGTHGIPVSSFKIPDWHPEQ